MSTDPRMVYVGGRGSLGGGGVVDLSGLNPYLEALMSRWNDVMDVQTERLSAMPDRDRIAFAEWRQGKDLAQNQQKLATSVAYEQERDREEELLRARKAESSAAAQAQAEERARLQASVDRARALQSTYGGPTPFNPQGAVADYYEYGAGNPQGRGGGGSVGGGHVSDSPGGVGSAEWAAMDLKNCLANPAGPGCPELLQSQGYGG